MKTGIRAIVAAGLVFAASAPALAGDTQRLHNAAGLNVTYSTDSGRYCMRTHSDVAAKRHGLRLHATECRTKEGWARQGLTLARRGDTTQQQVASVD